MFTRRPSLPDYIRVSHKAVKYARIRIHHDASVELTVPKYYRQKDIQDLVERKSAWIADKRQHYMQQLANYVVFEADKLLWFDRLYQVQQHARRDDRFSLEPQPVVYSRHDLHKVESRLKWYRRKAKEELSQRLEALAKLHDMQYERVSVRDQKSRWGSCSSRGTISLNWRLVLAPEPVCHYVILHELAHTRHMNHSSDFWNLVGSMVPDYQSARTWLREQGNGLMNYI
jgi:predicted metal-dependent hydrolase